MPGVPHPFFRRLPLRPAAILLVLLALAPVIFIGLRVAGSTRDIAYWDEFDTALNLVLQLDRGIGLHALFDRLFEVSNEHRMVTSRLMFAASYWLTGTVNFSVISVLGNLSLVALCLLLILAMETTARRIRLAVLLAALLFQLEHYENFLWSGSSIDHFQVVLLAGAAVVILARGPETALAAAGTCAVLATFTLAHGLLVWPVGAWLLWHAGRRRDLVIWCALAAFAGLIFLAGFHVNSAQRFAEPTLAGAGLILHYWLALLGSVPAFGHPGAAPWLGGLLLAALGGIGWRSGLRRETVALPIAVYAVAALGLIAVGRAAESGGTIHSRYYVLGALAWALTAFMLLNRLSHPRRPLVVLWGCVPLFVAFNVAANLRFAPLADTWLECRDRAAVRYKQHGVDGRGPFTLYPVPARSTELLQEAERRGIYRMGPVCHEVTFPRATPSSRIAYFVEEVAVTPHAAAVVGWAAIPGLPSKRGQLHVVLRSGTESHIFTAVTVTRPDVAAALHRPECQLSGFRFARRRDNLPTGVYQIGFLIAHEAGAEFIMTDHRVNLIGDGKALLATAD